MGFSDGEIYPEWSVEGAERLHIDGKPRFLFGQPGILFPR